MHPSSWHQQYLDCITIINWELAHQASCNSVLELKNAIHFKVKANPKGMYKVGWSTDNGISFGIVVLTALTALFIANDFLLDMATTLVPLHAFLYAQFYLRKTVTNDLQYST